MKLTTLILLMLSLVIIAMTTSCGSYKKDKIPPFDLLLIDSTTILNTTKIDNGKPFILIYFSPDCDHCQLLTEDLLKNLKLFKNTHLYFVTSDPFERLKVFNNHYKIFRYPDITLAKDYSFFIQKYYKPKGTPYLAIYDKNKNLRVIIDGGAETKVILHELTLINDDV